MSSNGKMVCVTGASGFVASWLVKLLLIRGYTVKASVRDPADPKRTEHLRLLDGAKERLQLYKADLLEENSFDAIVDGCEGVFHTATPVFFTAKDPEAELIEPAIKGTLNVLSSCSRSPTVKRVIVTSSIAACKFNGTPLTSDVVVDESWFSCPKSCRENKLWYHLSKTLAEEVAWKYSKEQGIDMIMIHPAFIVGPLLQPTLNATSDIILKTINGTSSTYPNATYGWVNVQDVAKAHILAYEDLSASGRYCLAERVSHCSEVVELLRELYPSLQLPQKCEDDKPFSPVYLISKEKTKNLGIEYIPHETSLKEIVESLKEKGFISF